MLRSRSFQTGLFLLCGLVWVSPSQAGWQSPFELTCFRKRCTNYYAPPPSYYVPQYASYYAPPSNTCAPVQSCYTPPPPPTQVCTTNYVAKSYYEPVTTMQHQTHYEPVTRYETKWGYEPVTTTRSHYAFDPCHRACYPVYTQSTSYYMKPYTQPVTSFIARTTMVPVTQYRQMTYYEPQTSCQSCPQTAANPPAVSSGPVQTNWQSAPNISESRTPAVPGITENSRYATPNGYRAPVTNNEAPRQPVTPRMDRITSNSGWQPVQGSLMSRSN